MKKKIIIVIIILVIGLLLIIVPKLVFKSDNDNKDNKIDSTLINKELDITITNEDDDIKINDFIETKELYLFNLTNQSDKKLEFEKLTIEFYNEKKELIFTEDFNVSLEKDNIKTFQIRKDFDIKDKVKYIKLVTE